jgi:hypothetical protein
MILPDVPPNVSEEHLRQLAVARAGGKKIRRAVAVAKFDGWSIGVFGVLTLLCGLTDPTSIVLGLGMLAVAFVELRGADAIRRLDHRAARTLGMNQLALACLLILYSFWSIYTVSTGPGPYESIKAQDAEMARMLQPFESLTKTVSLAVYAILILFAIFFQGGMALYYFSRVKHIHDYASKTPPWIIKLQQAGMGI